MTAAIDTNLYADPQGLAQLRQQVRAEGDERTPETLRKVAGQFEALFVQQILKSMRDSTLNEGLMDNDQTKLYQGMFDQQISLEMTRGKGLGLADMLVRQLGGGDGVAKAPDKLREPVDPFLGPAMAARRPSPLAYGQARATTATSIVADAPSPNANTASPMDAPRREWQPNNQAEFVAELWPHAESAARKLGVDPKVLLAQAALETGWGQHIMQRRDGSSSHNLFGIKADSRWSGDQVSHRTVEFRHGVLQREQASFRAYASPGRSLEDYAEFIRDNPRYEDAVGSADPRRYVTELQRAGYATDPAYARKIMNIYNSDEFQYAVATAQFEQRQAATKAQEVSAMDAQPNTPSDSGDLASLYGGEG
ncbi:MAG TPA: flagellar assembly peptidoglycan hydrolase FlgJ [Gammaproteobacteria bacterium]|jgi:flagellar protein FlgJ|nr:flagellar assembly peptidoglycan hydrolase FlgJ [Gammaproteobacteria bacterium]